MNIQTLLKNPTYKQKFVLEKLLQAHLGLTREQIWLHLDDELTDQQLNQIQQDYHAYIVEKKPLEYILGHVDFFKIPFYVNEHTIIPRPETEYMISAVNECIQQQKKSDYWILVDIGTGSGILGISMLLQNPHFFQKAYLTDISEEALKVAKKNYDTLIPHSTNIQVHFLQTHLASFLTSELWNFLQSPEIFWINLVLVANLPYIPDETFDTNALEYVQKREPRLAFVGGNDGLDLYREMFNQIKEVSFGKMLKNVSLTMFLEMMTRQIKILKAEFGERLEFEEVKTFHFNIRIVKVNISSMLPLQ